MTKRPEVPAVPAGRQTLAVRHPPDGYDPALADPPAPADCRAFDDPVYAGLCLAGCRVAIRSGFERRVAFDQWGQRVCAHCAEYRLGWPVAEARAAQESGELAEDLHILRSL